MAARPKARTNQSTRHFVFFPIRVIQKIRVIRGLKKPVHA